MEDKVLFEIVLEFDRKDFDNIQDGSDIAKHMKVKKSTMTFYEDGEEIVEELSEEDIMKQVKGLFGEEA